MSRNAASPVYLVADVGGTNTRIGLAPAMTPGEQSVAYYENAGFGALADVIRAYLAGHAQARPDAVAVAIAGPVAHGRGRLTNLDWQADAETLAEISGAPVAHVLNDLAAQGYALDHLAPAAVERVLAGEDGGPGAGAARLVVGIGTGFNAAAVHTIGARAFVAPGECGHAALCGRGPVPGALADWIAERNGGFASVEDALSGRGLENCDLFLAGGDGPAGKRRATEIVAAAHRGEDRALRAVRLFRDVLGAVIGDLALTFLPFGGIYLTGGVARSVLPFLGGQGFAGAFRAKGRFATFMERFPVSVVTDDTAALTGCTAYLRGLEAQGQPSQPVAQ